MNQVSNHFSLHSHNIAATVETILDQLQDKLLLDAPTVSLTRDLLCAFLEYKQSSEVNSAIVSQVSKCIPPKMETHAKDISLILPLVLSP